MFLPFYFFQDENRNAVSCIFEEVLNPLSYRKRSDFADFFRKLEAQPPEMSVNDERQRLTLGADLFLL